MTGPVVPAVQLLGDAVLFRGPAVRDLALLLPIAVAQVERRDGIRRPQRWIQILDTVATARAAVPATALRVEAESEQWLTTARAAEELGVGERYIRKIAPLLGGYRGRGGWLIPRTSIEQRRTK